MKNTICNTCKYAAICLGVSQFCWVRPCPECGAVTVSFRITPPFGEPRVRLERSCPKVKELLLAKHKGVRIHYLEQPCANCAVRKDLKCL